MLKANSLGKAPPCLFVPTWLRDLAVAAGGLHVLGNTQSILNYKTFDFFDIKFDHSSYSKICVKYHFFRRGLIY